MDNQPDLGSGGGSVLTSVPAIIAAVATLVTAIGGLFAYLGGDPETPKDTTNQKTVNFTIRDPLGPDQISEEVNVKIDGKNAGTLTVDQNNRSDQINASVDEGEGKYDYSLASVSVYRDQSGRPVELSGSGQGSINVKDGKTYELYGHPVGSGVELSLAEP